MHRRNWETFDISNIGTNDMEKHGNINGNNCTIASLLHICFYLGKDKEKQRNP